LGLRNPDPTLEGSFTVKTLLKISSVKIPIKIIISSKEKTSATLFKLNGSLRLGSGFEITDDSSDESRSVIDNFSEVHEFVWTRWLP